MKFLGTLQPSEGSFFLGFMESVGGSLLCHLSPGSLLYFAEMTVYTPTPN
jgi:hypothetical protein